MYVHCRLQYIIELSAKIFNIYLLTFVLTLNMYLLDIVAFHKQLFTKKLHTDVCKHKVCN